MLRSIGRAVGEVAVRGGAEKVCDPRLPKLPPRPALASASLMTSNNDAAMAASASSGRYLSRSISILPDAVYVIVISVFRIGM
jgi:hypothetical protein